MSLSNQAFEAQVGMQINTVKVWLSRSIKRSRIIESFLSPKQPENVQMHVFKKGMNVQHSDW